MTLKETQEKYLFYFLTVFLLIGILSITFRINFYSNILIYAIVEVSSLTLLLIIGSHFLIRFFNQKINKSLTFISAAFLGAFFLEIYHIVFVLSNSNNSSSSQFVFLAFLTWIPAKLFMSSIIFLSSIVWKEKSKQQQTSLSILLLIFILFSFIISAFFALNPTVLSILSIKNPQEIIPGLFYFFAFIFYFKKGFWKNDLPEYILMHFLIVISIIQLAYLPFAKHPFDAITMVSHLLRIASYTLIFISINIDFFSIFKQVEQAREQSNAQNIAFKEARIELEQALKNSVIKTAELSTKIKDLENTKKAIFNLLEDLNEEKAKVEEAKAKDEAFLSSIGEGMIVTDKEGKAMLINKQAEIMLGYQSKDLIGKKWAEIVNMIDEKGNPVTIEKRPVYLALSSGKKVVNSIYSYITREGTKLPITITASPVVINNAVEGTIVVFRDVTREREVDRMKTEFISLASHQLRTPLSAIKWFTEMLLNGDAGKLTDEQKEFTNNIYESTERMIELVNSLLNISRIESGRIIIDPQPTDLCSLVRSVLSEIKPRLDFKNQKLVISFHEQLPNVNIDPKLIRQVYLNLLTNAIKYTPEKGEIHVFISKKGEDIISQISDNGYGIPKKETDKVFQKFYRGENIVKIETDGNGLGLYLVKSIIESSNGKIWFETEENKGTSFWFSLPISGVKLQKGQVTLSNVLN